ncbi:PREDICTED: uncharacterized protein LOC109157440 [Ipomoea nil]|uniref:uncharacterized protein LOC109157440 n=1 Tax=Ipomoea nil TaxID=35883 RepID=UPI000901F1B3|nr:PREDICTED: uncharacterized protein LOC109157440 [Ipomoea nil]
MSNYNSLSTQRSADFALWIQNEGLIDLGFSGSKLTWVKEGSVNPLKGTRLDRALCNVDWKLRFPDVTVTHLPRISSDHAPILLQNKGGRKRSNISPFIFQAAWLTHPDFRTVVRHLWREDQSLETNTNNLAEGLKSWNKTVFGNIHTQKRILMFRLAGVQRCMANGFHGGLGKLEKKL